MSNPTVPQTQQPSSQALCKYDNDQLKTIRDSVFPDGSREEVTLFGIVCTKTGLDPFTRQIYAMKDRRGKVSFITGIDGFRVVAERTGTYAGQDGPFWCSEDGNWSEIWTSDAKPVAAKVIVRKTINGVIATTSAVAHWSEYGSDGYMWKKMPALMLAKCAEALALRKAFPNDLSGLYTSDEVDQAQVSTQSSPPVATRPEAVGSLVESVLGSGEEPISSDGTNEETQDAEYEEVPEPTERAQPAASTPQAAAPRSFTKADFITLLESKGINTEKTAMLVVKRIAEDIANTGDMRKVSDEDKGKIYDFIKDAHPDDLIPF